MLPSWAAALFATGLAAQTTSYVAPFGCQSNPGNGGNTIPWWSGSATYQQVHDAADLAWVFPAPVAVIRAISFRPSINGNLPARVADAQVTLGNTTTTAATASTTFALNLGGNPVVALPYTSVNLPAVTGRGGLNPQAWFFPFQAPFVYVIPQGNLCWELRLKNSSSMAISATDALDRAPAGANFMPLLGSGCTATGQTQPATIGDRSLALGTGTLVHRLDGGCATSPAALVLGGARQVLQLPGMCGALQTAPLVALNGTTGAAGGWNHVLVLGDLTGMPRGTVYAQFVWADAGLPYGLGVSPCSPVTLPGASTFGLARIYFGNNGTGQGNETATTGNADRSYGLAVGFDA
jgi:hypothetical protein